MRPTALAACVALALLGCSTEETTPTGPTVLPGPTEWNRPVEAPADTEAEQQRAACAYDKGSLPAETQGASHPMGSDIPIDHILVSKHIAVLDWEVGPHLGSDHLPVRCIVKW